MTVEWAIRVAEDLLPGEAAPEGETDPRWQAIIRVGDFIESDPEAVWSFIERWGPNASIDLRTAIATCLLEHLLEQHFSAYFSRVEVAVRGNRLFADTFRRCWKLGQAEEPGNADRFDALLRETEEATG